MALPTNFIDDILASSNLKRKYKMVNNPDGTVSFDDVTQYQQIGSEFGAKQINETNGGINEINNKRLKTLNEVNLTTQAGFFVDALAIKELANNSIDKIQRQETVINSKVEGKQIYTKAFEIHPIPSNTFSRFQINIPDAKYIWLDASNSYAYNVQGGEIYPIPYISPKYPQNGLGVWINNSPQKQEIIIETATTWPEKYYAWIVLKYYKK